MKDFARQRGRLRALPLAARVVYSVFAAFTLLGLGFSVWLTEEMVGADLGGIDSYYAGTPQPGTAEPQPGTSEPQPGTGPALELPDEAMAEPVAEPMALRRLLEVTHFHLFSMPVYLLILSHLFMLSASLGDRVKLAWIGAGSVAVLIHMAAPWVARTGHAASTAVYAGSGTLLLLSFLVMSGVPLYEMWSAGPDSR